MYVSMVGVAYNLIERGKMLELFIDYLQFKMLEMFIDYLQYKIFTTTKEYLRFHGTIKNLYRIPPPMVFDILIVHVFN